MKVLFGEALAFVSAKTNVPEMRWYSFLYAAKFFVIQSLVSYSLQ